MSTKTEEIVAPVMRVTLYDWVSSWAIALFAGIFITCLLVVTVWVTNRAPKPPGAIPVEMVELPGGFEDGSPDETLRVDSPLPEVRDASPVDVADEQMEIAEAVETVVQNSESATELVQQQFETGIQNTGTPGRATGTGKRALGMGNGTGGMPREQRWFVKFADRIPLNEYTRQLEFFGIELGALLPDGRLAYLSKPASDSPPVRYVTTGSAEQRLYMTWQGGDRRAADVQIFAKAGLSIRGDTVIFHFYPKQTENELAQLELAYRNRTVKQIRRTYFAVEGDGQRYKFTVFKQVTFQ